MALVGAAVIGLWAKGLITDTGGILLDREMDHPLAENVRAAVETDLAAGATRVVDLHVWRVGRQSFACALSVVTHDAALTPERVRAQLAALPAVAHATIEIHQCRTESAPAAPPSA
jgi:Co/Zn/Cd efflux system component